MLRFSEELLLMLLNEESGDFSSIPPRTLDYTLAGATLTDLAFEGRIDTDSTSLTLIDPTPVGDELLDPILAEIAADWDNLADDALPRIPEFWVRRIAGQFQDLRDKMLERLTENGLLDTDDARVIFTLSRPLLRTRRYMTAEGQYEREVHDRIMSVLFNEEIPSPADAAHIGLAHACGHFRSILTTSEYEQVRERIELIAGLDRIGGMAVANAIRKLSLAETQALSRTLRRQGGGWPQASGALPIAGHAFKMAGNVGKFLTQQYQKLGPVFEVRVFGQTYVVLAGQEANLFMIRQGAAHLRSWESWRGFKNEIGTPHIITGLDGADHRRLRKAMRDGYSRNAILRQIPSAVAVVERELSRLTPERPVSGFYTMQRITTEQICLLTSGTSAIDFIDDAIAFINMLESVHLTHRLPNIMMKLPRVRRARRRLEVVFEDILAAHEPELRVGAQPDLIDDLLNLHSNSPEFMSGADLFINVIGPFLLGLDTVAGSSAFMLYALLKDRDLLERARAEADELFAGAEPNAEGIRRMTTTQQVLMETLRMYPIAPALPRTAMNAFEFGGYHIPAGTQVLVAISVPHYLPEFYPNPHQFDIERYSPERREHARPGVFAPFGLGHHACLGQGFAQVQMILTIAAMLNKADLAMEPPDYRLKISYSPIAHPNHSFKFRMLARRWSRG